MTRPTNRRCRDCAKLSTKEAHLKACWSDQRCHNRRSYYRRQAELEKQTQSNALEVPTLVVPVPDIVYAVLYRYQFSDRRLHAIGAELYQGEALMAKSNTVHVAGWTERTIKQHLQNILESFSTHMGKPIALFRDSVVLAIDRCPVENCPLQPVEDHHASV